VGLAHFLPPAKKKVHPYFKKTGELKHVYSLINSAMSSNLQSNAIQSLSNVFVSIFSFAFKRRTVLLSIPHYSRSVYVDIPFSFIVTQSLSNTIIFVTTSLDISYYGGYNQKY